VRLSCILGYYVYIGAVRSARSLISQRLNERVNNADSVWNVEFLVLQTDWKTVMNCVRNGVIH